jgi:transposase
MIMVLPLAVGLSCHLTFDKSDPKDAVIVARLHCYEPERADAVWARLRHLGARRTELTADATAR